jgi:hypothetical protein
MNDLSATHVIPFYEKSNEWQTWSEKVTAKAKRFGFKGIFLEYQSFPKSIRFLMLN